VVCPPSRGDSCGSWHGIQVTLRRRQCQTDRVPFAIPRSLALSEEGFGLSWTRSGALIPTDSSPSALFARLFIEGRPDEVAAQAQRLRDGQSILDMVRDQAGTIHSALGSRDRGQEKGSEAV